MNIDDIRTMYAFNRWANLRMFSAVEKLTCEQFTANLQSSFPSVRESVFHIFGAEWIWLKRWQGKSPQLDHPVESVSSAWTALRSDGMPPPQDLSTLSRLRLFADSIETEREEFMRTLADEVLHTPLNFHDMSGKAFSEPLGELMQHVVNHGTYHRGQVTTLLRQNGAPTVSLDMLYFFRERRERTAGR